MVLKELTFNSFFLWEGVVILKELIFNSFYFGEEWWSRKNLFSQLYIERVWWF